MKTEIYFSAVVRDDSGTKTSEVSVLETLAVDYDKSIGKFKAVNADGQSTRCGYGNGHTEAVLDYLRLRLGLDLKPPTIKYSSRVY